MTFILQENLHSALAHLRQSGIHEVDCQQLAVSTLATLGSGHYFKPHNPVLSSPVRRKKTMAETFDPHCVWFVGAGPGDRELITLKGYRLLQQAQVVIYAGSLINTELLAYCPPQAECHDSAALHLEQILDLMEAG